MHFQLVAAQESHAAHGVRISLAYEDAALLAVLAPISDQRTGAMVPQLASRESPHTLPAHPSGRQRPRQRDRGTALAGKSTLHRLELPPSAPTPRAATKRVSPTAMPGRSSSSRRSCRNTFDCVRHGHPWGRFFHGYSDAYGYLRVDICGGAAPLPALLRPSNIDHAAGVLKHRARIVARLSSARPSPWPRGRIRASWSRRSRSKPSPGRRWMSRKMVAAATWRTASRSNR